MNPYIPKLLRVKYAINKILDLRKLFADDYEEAKVKRKTYCDEIDLPLFVEKDGKRTAINGRYVGRLFNDIEERCCNVEKKSAASHQSEISQPIKNLNLRKRIMGIKKGVENYEPEWVYKKTIVDYLDLGTWQELETDAEILYRQMYEEIKSRHIASSRFGRISITHSIKPKMLNKDDIVKLVLNRDAKIELKCLGNCQFKVTKMQGLSLQKDDVLLITSPFIRKNCMYAEVRYCSNLDCGEYLSAHTILDFELIEGSVTRQKRREEEDARLLEIMRKSIAEEFGEH